MITLFGNPQKDNRPVLQTPPIKMTDNKNTQILYVIMISYQSWVLTDVLQTPIISADFFKAMESKKIFNVVFVEKHKY